MRLNTSQLQRAKIRSPMAAVSIIELIITARATAHGTPPSAPFTRAGLPHLRQDSPGELIRIGGQGRQPWPLRDVPNGRRRGVAADVRGNPVSDRPAAGPTRASESGRWGQMRQTTTGEVRLDERKRTDCNLARRATRRSGCKLGWLRSIFVVRRPDETEDHAQRIGNPGNVRLVENERPTGRAEALESGW